MNTLYAIVALMLIGLYTAVVYWAASTKSQTKVKPGPNYNDEVDEKLQEDWEDISGMTYKGI